MRVSYLYDIPLPMTYAASIQILQTCRELAEQGVPTAVYVRRLAHSPSDCLKRYGLTPHPLLDIRPLFGTLRYKLAPGSALRKVAGAGGEPHFLISRGECGIQLYGRLNKLGLQRNQRWIYEAHRPCTAEHLPLPLNKIRELERSAVAEASGLICLTPAVQDALGALYRLPSRVLILPSGTTLPTVEPPADESRDIDIFYAGKLDQRKGVRALILAMRHLPDYRVHIAGGPQKRVEELRLEARRLGVESRVNFLGFIEPGKIEALYARARVGVCPLPAGESSISEHFTSPMKILSMMAWGVPVVATDVPSVRGLLQHNVTGLLATAGDSVALADAIRKLLRDREHGAKMRAAALLVVRQYSWQNRARLLREFLGRIG